MSGTQSSSSGVHPKVAAGGIAGAVVTVIMLAVQQYFPHYAPNADLAAGVTALASTLASYFKGA